MQLQAIRISNNNIKSGQTSTGAINSDVIKYPEIHESTLSNKKKLGIFATTLIGVGAAMAYTLKGKGYSLKARDIINTIKKDPKKLGLLNVTYDSKKHEVEKLVGTLAVGSVGGGLLGGAIFDKKENFKAKTREAIIQIIGNIATPLLCVSGGMSLFEKNEEKILDSMKFLKGKAKGIPSVVASGVCLVAGIILGNKVGNTINQKVFHTNEERKLKLADMSPHIDDLALAISLVASQSPIGPAVTRIIPAALTIAGFSTGIAQEHTEK